MLRSSCSTSLMFNTDTTGNRSPASSRVEMWCLLLSVSDVEFLDHVTVGVCQPRVLHTNLADWRTSTAIFTYDWLIIGPSTHTHTHRAPCTQAQFNSPQTNPPGGQGGIRWRAVRYSSFTWLRSGVNETLLYHNSVHKSLEFKLHAQHYFATWLSQKLQKSRSNCAEILKWRPAYFMLTNIYLLMQCHNSQVCQCIETMNVQVYHSCDVVKVNTHNVQWVAVTAALVTWQLTRSPSRDTHIDPHHQLSTTLCMDSETHLHHAPAPHSADNTTELTVPSTLVNKLNSNSQDINKTVVSYHNHQQKVAGVLIFFCCPITSYLCSWQLYGILTQIFNFLSLSILQSWA